MRKKRNDETKLNGVHLCVCLCVYEMKEIEFILRKTTNWLSEYTFKRRMRTVDLKEWQRKIYVLINLAPIIRFDIIISDIVVVIVATTTVLYNDIFISDKIILSTGKH